MDLELLLSCIRDNLRKISENKDTNAIKNIIKTILEFRDKTIELKIISQLIHDEKTYVLSDTEILRTQEHRLIDVAALYHIIYELCRILIMEIEDRIVDLDKAVSEKNLTDITHFIDNVLIFTLEGLEDKLSIAITNIKNVERKISNKDLRNNLMLSIFRNLEYVVSLIREVKREVQ